MRQDQHVGVYKDVDVVTDLNSEQSQRGDLRSVGTGYRTGLLDLEVAVDHGAAVHGETGWWVRTLVDSQLFQRAGCPPPAFGIGIGLAGPGCVRGKVEPMQRRSGQPHRGGWKPEQVQNGFGTRPGGGAAVDGPYEGQRRGRSRRGRTCWRSTD